MKEPAGTTTISGHSGQSRNRLPGWSLARGRLRRNFCNHGRFVKFSLARRFLLLFRLSLTLLTAYVSAIREPDRRNPVSDRDATRVILGTIALLVGQAHVGFPFKQRVDNIEAGVGRRGVEGRIAVLVLAIRVGTALEKRLDYLEVGVLRREMERGPALGVASIRIGTGPKEKVNYLLCIVSIVVFIIRDQGQNQCRRASLVLRVGVGVMGQQ